LFCNSHSGIGCGIVTTKDHLHPPSTPSSSNIEHWNNINNEPPFLVPQIADGRYKDKGRKKERADARIEEKSKEGKGERREEEFWKVCRQVGEGRGGL